MERKRGKLPETVRNCSCWPLRAPRETIRSNVQHEAVSNTAKWLHTCSCSPVPRRKLPETARNRSQKALAESNRLVADRPFVRRRHLSRGLANLSPI
eukprot:1085373-Alexandrium_andersonii.AAC.1